MKHVPPWQRDWPGVSELRVLAAPDGIRKRRLRLARAQSIAERNRPTGHEALEQVDLPEPRIAGLHNYRVDNNSASPWRARW